MGKYEDMIDRERPSSKRKKMPTADRAKIFMPFSALTGLDDLIAEKQKITTERVILSEERKAELDQRLGQLEQSLAQGTKEFVSVQVFVKEEQASQEQGMEVGIYKMREGVLRKIDFLTRTVRIDEELVNLDDIIEIRLRSRY